MKTTIQMTILAISLSLGMSGADVPMGVHKVEEHDGSVKPSNQAGEQSIAGSAEAEQKPVQVNLTDNADRAKPPRLLAPNCSTCIKPPAFSPWQQFQLMVPILHWVA